MAKPEPVGFIGLLLDHGAAPSIPAADGYQIVTAMLAPLQGRHPVTALNALGFVVGVIFGAAHVNVDVAFRQLQKQVGETLADATKLTSAMPES